MKVTLLEPRGGTLDLQTTADACSLVSVAVTREQLAPLTPLELQLVYDWAMREHLAASGHRTQRRRRPACLDLVVKFAVYQTETTSRIEAVEISQQELELVAAQQTAVDAELAQLRQRVVELTAELAEARDPSGQFSEEDDSVH